LQNTTYALFAASHPTIAFFLDEPHRYWWILPVLL